MSEKIKIVIAKGRLLKAILPLLESAGLGIAADSPHDRKLILPSRSGDVEFVIVRAADVATYVEYGAADLGIVGKDMLMEFEGNSIYELSNLGIAHCRMSLAALAHRSPPTYRPRVATKYIHSAKRYFAEQDRQVSIIKLYGSMEMAPVLGLSDLIIDLVDTGKTLKENGLVEIEKIKDITARLIANKACMKIKERKLRDLVGRIENALPSTDTGKL